MKLSRYNIFVEKDKGVICYNSFSDNILVLKKSIYDDFVYCNIKYFASKHKHVYETLLENGFLIPNEKDELDVIRLEHKQAISDTRHLQLMVYPTQDCNLRCWYCYENHVKNSRMSEEVKKNIILFVDKYIQDNKLESLNLTFLGGEPLLSFNRIAYPLARSIKLLCEKNNIKFTTFFITNASLINENMIERFKDINAYFQITLDGCREKHNQVRVGKVDSFKTYDRIINAVSLLSHSIQPSSNTKFSLTLRINYDNDTLKNTQEILDDIRNVNKDVVFIHLERVWQTIGKIDEEQKSLLISSMRMFAKAGFHVGVGVFGNKRYSCPAEKLNYAIVNYNGLVYRCNGRNLTENTKEGFLKDDGSIEWDANRLAARLGRTTFENEMCLNCKMLPQCMGPCSQKNIENDWNDLKNVCSLKSIDMSLEQYVLLKCELNWILNK